MSLKTKLSTLVVLGALTLADCGQQRPELESPRSGRLNSGVRYTTWTKYGSSRDYNNRALALSDGITIELIDHDGTRTLAGDYLQTYDIKRDGKLVLTDEEFKARIQPNSGSNVDYWKEHAVGDSEARARAISRVNEFYESIGSSRRVYEGSPDIDTATKRRLEKNK